MKNTITLIKNTSLLLACWCGLFAANTSASAQSKLPESQYQLTNNGKDYVTLPDGKPWKVGTSQPFKRGKVFFMGWDDSGKPVYKGVDNASAAVSINANRVAPGGAAGYSLNGAGVKVSVWDGGRARLTHRELRGRVYSGGDAVTDQNDDHATHVSGTIGATGVSAQARGMAPLVAIRSFDFGNDDNEMTAAARDSGVYLSNHSYGTISGWQRQANGDWYWYGDPTVSDTVDYNYGLYSSGARGWDQLAFTYPNYLIVKSAGNDRGDSGPAPGGSHFVQSAGGNWVASTVTRNVVGPYDCIATEGNAKNILTIGAVNPVPTYTSASSVRMSSFSGWGPSDDGRIKPDVVGQGVNVFSSVGTADDAYDTYQGTSMSSPNVTGGLALVHQHAMTTYRRRLRSATIKGLAIHTAREAGPSIGPDYQFGWGLVDVLGMVNMITNDRITSRVLEKNLTNRAVFDTTATYVANTGPIVVTLCWTDPAGAAVSRQLNNRNARLINDLDIRLYGPNGDSTLPYRLSPTAPGAAATTGDNVVDNVEKIFLAAPVAGNYRIVIRHKRNLLNNQSQAYSLLISGLRSVTPTYRFNAPAANANLNLGLPTQILGTGNLTGSYRIQLVRNDTVITTIANSVNTIIYANGAWTPATSLRPGVYRLRCETVATPVQRFESANFNLIAAAPLTVTSFSPTQGAPGTVVTMTGTGFLPGTTFSFGSVAGTGITVLNSTTATVSVPTGAAPGPTTIAAANGATTSQAPSQFTVLAAAPTFCGGTYVMVDTMRFTPSWQTLRVTSGTKVAVNFFGRAGQTYSFSSCTTATSAPDSYLRIYSANDPTTILAANDDNGIACNTNRASIDFTPTTTGRYYMVYTRYVCENFLNNDAVQYRSTPSGPPMPPICSADTNYAGVITPSNSVQNQSVPVGPVQIYQFAGQTGRQYDFWACGNTGSANTILRVYNLAGNIIASNDDSCGVKPALRFSPTTSENFYVVYSNFICQGLTQSEGFNYQIVQPCANWPGTTAIPRVGLTAGSINRCARDTAELRLLNTGVVPGTIQWFRNGTLVGSGNTFRTPLSGSYTAQYRNGICTSTLSQPVVLTFGTVPAFSVTRAGMILTATPGLLAYRWFGPSGRVTGAAANTLDGTNLPSGDYYCQADYASGPNVCTITSATVVLGLIYPTTCITIPAPLQGGRLSPTLAIQTVQGQAGQSHIWYVEMDSNITYTFRTCSSSVAQDTYLRLYDEAGNLLSESDDACVGNKSNIAYLPTSRTRGFIHFSRYTCATLSISETLEYFRDNGPCNITETPILTQDGTFNLCPDGTINLSANPIPNTEIVWYRNGQEFGTGANFSVAATGTYTLRYRRGTCLGPFSTLTAVVVPAPNPGLQLIRSGDTLRLNLQGSNITWFRDGVEIPGQFSSTLVVRTSGSYYASVNVDGCTFATTPIAMVIANPCAGLPTRPTINVSGNLSICQGDSVILEVAALQGLDVVWFPGNVRNNRIVVRSPGQYTARYQNPACTSQTATPVIVTLNSNTLATPAVMQTQIDSLVVTNAIAGARYDWRLNGDIIVSNGPKSIKIAATGSYSVMAKSTGICNSPLGFMDVVVLSAHQIVGKLSFGVYPNPSANQFSIAGINQAALVQLYDAKGQLVKTWQDVKADDKLDISQFASGAYRVRVIDSQNAAVLDLQIR